MKKVMIYGNCHTSRIIIYLQNCKEFNSLYEIIPIPPIQVIYKDQNVVLDELPFDKCDIFIHQSIRENNRYGKEFSSIEIIKRLKSNCQIISIPNLYHMPMYMFPQYVEKKEFVFKDTTCFFRDKILDDIYARNGTLKEAVQIYCNTNLYSDMYLETLWLAFLEKVKKRELEWDIKISDYLLENQNKHLFYDPNHPTNMLLDHISDCLLEKLGIEKATFIKHNLNFNLDAYEMPLCQSVVKYFQINRKPSVIRHSGKKIYAEKMVLKKYILQYWSLEWQNEELTSVQRDRSYCTYLKYMKKSKIKNWIIHISMWFKSQIGKYLKRSTICHWGHLREKRDVK